MNFKFRRFLRTVVILSIIVYFTFKMVSGFLMDEKLTETVVYGQLNIENAYDGIIFRNELIVGTNVEGNIRYNVADGDKVKKGLKIAEIYRDAGDVSGVQMSESGTEEVVSAQMLTISEEDLNVEIDKLVDALLEARRNQDFIEVHNLKQDLDLKLDKLEMLKNMESISGSGFEEAFVGGGVLSEGQSISLYSPKAGIVTFASDGMESALTPENIFKLDYDNLLDQSIQVKSLTTNYVTNGSPIYKIVDNSVWMLVAIIEKSEIGLYDEGKYVKVRINDEDVTGVVSKVFETGEKGALVLKMTEQVAGFHKERIVKATIIRENYQGLKIPSSAVVNRQGLQGVFILGVDNKAMFKPVRIIGYDQEFAIVKNGFVEVQTDEGPERVRSIDINDDVLIEGSKFNDGDLVY
jgi:putative membrane fusion protein